MGEDVDRYRLHIRVRHPGGEWGPRIGVWQQPHHRQADRTRQAVHLPVEHLARRIGVDLVGGMTAGAIDDQASEAETLGPVRRRGVRLAGVRPAWLTARGPRGGTLSSRGDLDLRDQHDDDAGGRRGSPWRHRDTTRTQPYQQVVYMYLYVLRFAPHVVEMLDITIDRVVNELARQVRIKHNGVQRDDRGVAPRQDQDARAERTRITADMVVQELALHAFGLIGDFFDSDTGRLLEIHEMPPEVQARLSTIVVLRERTHRVSTDVDETSVHESTIKIKLWDKLRALELLGRHLACSGTSSSIRARSACSMRSGESRHVRTRPSNAGLLSPAGPLLWEPARRARQDLEGGPARCPITSSKREPVG